MKEMTGCVAPISKDSVHRICSGQVVVSLAVALKELVENSLDAGSTNIEIRLKEYGTECIEVIDNGCGVQEENFENLTLKHYTSKLKEFDDLSTVSTFGFRGEALSALCATSEVSVVTCHRMVSVGTRLDYDHSGSIKAKSVCPRQGGTTVIVRNLFSTLPVRRREFLKNAKREFTKAVNVLNAYCLVSVDKRIVCTNQVGNSKNVIVSLHGNKTVRDNICDIFGAKQLSSLLAIRQLRPSESVMEEYFMNEHSVEEDFFRISGFVSTSVHGQGRSSSDRQYCFVNGRPCDLPKVTKVVNAAYHTFNKHQFPFLLLNIELNQESVDVNVTPDKRQIFVENEKLLLATVKTSIMEMYEPQSSFLGSVLSSSLKTAVAEVQSEVVSRSLSSRDDSTNCNAELSCVSRLKRNFSFMRNCEYKKEERNNPLGSPTKKQPRLEEFFSGSISDKNNLSVCHGEDDQMTMSECSSEEIPTYRIEFLSESPSSEPKQLTFDYERKVPESLNEVDDAKTTLSHDDHEQLERFTPTVCVQTEPNLATSQFSLDRSETEEIVFLDAMAVVERKVKSVSFSMPILRENLSKLREKSLDRKNGLMRRFRTKIDPTANEAAEQELEKELHKNMFAKMEIIGQFNLGFIIAKLDSDLFIIDQHATDEKYNYETLQKRQTLETQKLIKTQSLDLTAADEILLMEKLNVFDKNGFGFQIDMNVKAGERIKLSSIPVSKNWTFGKQDIAEMLFMLSDAPHGVMCRPSRIQQMFASRACRMSVMIGTALGEKEMKRLVVHMGEMDQPWNCPHGRPTIRQLLNLSMI